MKTEQEASEPLLFGGETAACQQSSGKPSALTLASLRVFLFMAS